MQEETKADPVEQDEGISKRIDGNIYLKVYPRAGRPPEVYVFVSDPFDLGEAFANIPAMDEGLVDFGPFAVVGLELDNRGVTWARYRAALRDRHHGETPACGDLLRRAWAVEHNQDTGFGEARSLRVMLDIGQERRAELRRIAPVLEEAVAKEPDAVMSELLLELKLLDQAIETGCGVLARRAASA